MSKYSNDGVRRTGQRRRCTDLNAPKKQRNNSSGRQTCKTITQAVWWIDPVNGNDSNSGLSPATALRTHTELECRYQGNTALPPVELLFGFLPIRPVRVNIVSDLPQLDPIGLQVTLGPDTFFLYQSTLTVIRTGTIAAFTPKSRPVNVPDVMTDPGLTGADLYMRMRITSGPRAGAVAYVAEVLPGGMAVTSDWSIANPAPLNAPTPTPPFPGLTPVIPQAGDTYVVERLTHVTMKADWEVYTTGNSQGFYPLIGINFTDFEFEATPAGTFVVNDIGAGGPAMSFFTCRFEPYAIFNDAFPFLMNCAALRGVCFHNGFNFIEGGATFNIGPQVGDLSRPHCINYEFAAGGIVDGDHMCYGGPSLIASESYVYVGLMSIFKANDSVSQLPPFLKGSLGFGVSIYTYGTVQSFQQLYAGAALWGRDNQKKGVFVDSTSTLKWDGFNIPTVMGLLGDYAIGADPTNAASTTVDLAALPVPIFVTLRNNTWLNVALAIGAGGFRQNAAPNLGGPQDPLTGARIVVSGFVP